MAVEPYRTFPTRQWRASRLQVTRNRAFPEVIHACAGPRRTQNDTWITREMIDAYCRLHELGHAHSFETWTAGRLVGGLYGVHIGGAFFGESMFIRPDLGGSGASKVCLVHLVEHLRASSRVANAIRNRISGDRVRDTGCSLKLFRAEAVRSLPLFEGMHRFLPTLLRMEGARVIELPVSHRPRRYGESKYGISGRFFEGLIDLLAVRWMQSRALRARGRS